MGTGIVIRYGGQQNNAYLTISSEDSSEITAISSAGKIISSGIIGSTGVVTFALKPNTEYKVNSIYNDDIASKIITTNVKNSGTLISLLHNHFIFSKENGIKEGIETTSMVYNSKTNQPTVVFPEAIGTSIILSTPSSASKAYAYAIFNIKEMKHIGKIICNLYNPTSHDIWCDAYLSNENSTSPDYTNATRVHLSENQSCAITLTPDINGQSYLYCGIDSNDGSFSSARNGIEIQSIKIFYKNELESSNE